MSLLTMQQSWHARWAFNGKLSLNFSWRCQGWHVWHVHPSDRIDSPLQEANLLKSRPECMACRSLRFQILRRSSACSPRFPAFLHLELVLLKDAHAAACSSRTSHVPSQNYCSTRKGGWNGPNSARFLQQGSLSCWKISNVSHSQRWGFILCLSRAQFHPFAECVVSTWLTLQHREKTERRM